jgi:adenosine deaminase
MRLVPKAELHVHLDCSLSFEALSRLDPQIEYAEYRSEFVAPPKCTSLADFLKRAPRGFQLMQTEEALTIAVEDLFQQFQRDGVIYAEIRFAPLLHTQGSLSPQQVVTAVDRATERCVRDFGIEARLILCSLRHFEAEAALKTALLVDNFSGSRVVALDIAGDEAGFPIDANVPAFRFAIERGLYRTAHAGEACGPESVWQTLRMLQPSRLGHGVRSIEDPALISHLLKEHIHLEVCPTSNVQTCVCGTYHEHPVRQLYEAGVSISINTDARTISDVTLSEEYEKLKTHFGWGLVQLRDCNLQAVNVAFVEDGTREVLRDKIAAGYA